MTTHILVVTKWCYLVIHTTALRIGYRASCETSCIMHVFEYVSAIRLFQGVQRIDSRFRLTWLILQSRGAQIPNPKWPGWLNFVRWCLSCGSAITEDPKTGSTYFQHNQKGHLPFIGHDIKDSVKLQLYLRRDFYNMIFKIKHKLLASWSAPTSPPPPNENFWERTCVAPSRILWNKMVLYFVINLEWMMKPTNPIKNSQSRDASNLTTHKRPSYYRW